MAETKIKKDKNGLYVLLDNVVYRPQHTESSYINYGHLASDDTGFKQAEKVSTRAITDTDLATVRRLTIPYKESWFWHGTIMEAGKKKRSSSCWIPRT